MRNAYSENVMEHSWEVATIAHALALIKNHYFGGTLDANQVATAALYHDVTEIITGDLPTPIKYHSAAIQQAFTTIEQTAAEALLQLLPAAMYQDFQPLLQGALTQDMLDVLKMADKISAYLKCQAELAAGNQEFQIAATELRQKIEQSPLQEVAYFMATFAPNGGLPLD